MSGFSRTGVVVPQEADRIDQVDFVRDANGAVTRLVLHQAGRDVTAMRT